MKFTGPSGKSFTVSKPNKYKIDWSGKSLSKFQFNAKQFLETYWKYDVVFEEFPVPRTRMSFDFFNLTTNVAVEVQGIQHTKYNKFFHGGTNYKYLTQLQRDQFKFDFCQDYGIVLVEIYSEKELTKEFFKKQGVIL